MSTIKIHNEHKVELELEGDLDEKLEHLTQEHEAEKK